MLNRQDYYSHTIQEPVKISQSNNVSNTYIITTAERNKLIYPNPYKCVVNFDSTITDIIEIEIIRLYYNLSLPLINEYNNQFEFHIFINGSNYLFSMDLGEIYMEDYGNMERTLLIDNFNKQYSLKLENYISSWFDKNLSNLIHANDNLTVDYPLIKLFLNYSVRNNRYFFNSMSDNTYKTPININSPDVSNNSYSGSNNRTDLTYNYSNINYSQFGFDIRGNETTYQNTRPDTNVYTYNTNNSFLELLGFSTNQDIYDNIYTTDIVDMSVYTREYLDTSFKIIGIRLKYNDNSISVIGNNTDNINTDGDYENKINYNSNQNNIENVISTITGSEIIELPNSTNKTIIDILYNIQITTIYYQVININIKQDNSEIYKQIKYAIQSNEPNIGIKIESIINSIVNETFYIENFENPISTTISGTYDLSYFNNIYNDNIDSNGNYAPFNSIKTFKRNVGYLGYIERPSGELCIKWGRIKKEVYGDNNTNGIVLNNAQLNNIVTNNAESTYLFNNIITQFAMNEFNGTNGSNIYPNNEFSTEEPDSVILQKNGTVLATLNFVFSGLIPSYNSFEYILLDIEQLNNNNSNNPHIRDSFIEIPIRNLNLYEMNNIGFSTKYFNPPLAKLNKLSIKLKTADGKIIDGTKYNGDLTLFLKIKQLNSNMKYITN
tara:strand:+ start:2456 stop:4450 length:1995 start_codon:yes stop_codon:yes gene_type:complete